MSTFATRRPKTVRRLAVLAFALTLVSLVGSDALAWPGGGGRLHDYFAGFYGRDYYDGQRTGLRAHRPNTQYHGGFYGPAMMYDRQYGDENGYRTDPPFAPLRKKIGTGYGYDD